MKKILIIAVALMLCSCSKPKVENTSALDAVKELGEIASLDTSEPESLLNINVAERYGINPSDVEEGYVISSSQNGVPDKIIIAKGKNTTATQNIEDSLSNVLINLGRTYKDSTEQSKKIEEHIFKTRDKLTLLAVCNNTDKLKEVFNSYD